MDFGRAFRSAVSNSRWAHPAPATASPFPILALGNRPLPAAISNSFHLCSYRDIPRRTDSANQNHRNALHSLQEQG